MRPSALVRAVGSLAVVLLILVGSVPSETSHSTRESRAPTAQPIASSHGGGPVGAAVSRRLTFRLPSVNGQHYTPNASNIALRSTDGGPLLLFLPATRSVPRDYRSFLETASGEGYHVLALDYWNLGLSVARTCGALPRCYGNVQANRFDGSHPTRFSAISRGDSILSRLTHALTVLDTRDPAGGWDQYLHGGRIRWDRIVLAGHSQGGGESAYIAHRHQVHGVLLFASPVSPHAEVVAAWMARRGVTPASRYYGFGARSDEFAPGIQASWAAMGIGGGAPPVRIGDTVPFGGGHRLVTNLRWGTPRETHMGVITDQGPRDVAGVPIFRPIWLWMLRAVRDSPTRS